MFYTKNVPGWERILRLIIGMAALALPNRLSPPLAGHIPQKTGAPST